jgi:hypothetical protein
VVKCVKGSKRSEREAQWNRQCLLLWGCEMAGVKWVIDEWNEATESEGE